MFRFSTFCWFRRGGFIVSVRSEYWCMGTGGVIVADLSISGAREGETGESWAEAALSDDRGGQARVLSSVLLMFSMTDLPVLTSHAWLAGQWWPLASPHHSLDTRPLWSSSLSLMCSSLTWLSPECSCHAASPLSQNHDVVIISIVSPCLNKNWLVIIFLGSVRRLRSHNVRSVGRSVLVCLAQVSLSSLSAYFVGQTEPNVKYLVLFSY